MPWCPNCKLEYVEGKKMCPDCKTALVDKLPLEEELNPIEEEYYNESEEDFNESMAGASGLDQNEVLKQVYSVLRAQGMGDEEIEAMIQNMQQQKKNAATSYKPISDKYEEHKSGAVVLTVCGILGLLVLILKFVGVLNLPISGFSLYLTSGVMGFLFFVFLVYGMISMSTAKKLKPQVSEEEDKIKDLLTFVKEKKTSGAFNINTTDFYPEELSLIYTNMAVRECEKAYEDLPVGFAYYVVDTYYNDIFEDNENEN